MFASANLLLFAAIRACLGAESGTRSALRRREQAYSPARKGALTMSDAIASASERIASTTAKLDRFLAERAEQEPGCARTPRSQAMVDAATNRLLQPHPR